MNKEQINGVLQCCLLGVDNISFDELTLEYNFNPIIEEAGIKLCKFLKEKEVDCKVFRGSK